MLPAPRAAHQLTLAGDHLATRDGQRRHTCYVEAFERVVTRSRMETPTIDSRGSPRVEDHQVGVTADGNRALLRVKPENASGVGGKHRGQRVHRDAAFANPL